MVSPPASLILASTSPYRRMLLDRLGVRYSVEAPGVDETRIPQETPVALARRLATAKAQAVAARHREAVVIGSDQVAVAGEAILGKPGEAPLARQQLARLSGAVAHFHTVCAVVRSAPGFSATHLDTTRVAFRALTPEEIDRYIVRERPFDCAASFKVETLGISLLERIESEDPTGIIGLPLIWLAATLRGLGFEVP
jgi:septum formation protein